MVMTNDLPYLQYILHDAKLFRQHTLYHTMTNSYITSSISHSN